MTKSKSSTFVAPIAHSVKPVSKSATDSPPKRARTSGHRARVQTLIHSSPQGFGAAEEMEVFLQVDTRPARKTLRGGASSKRIGNNVTRKADSYVMRDEGESVVMHPGF